MSSEQQIIEKLDLIINLLTKQASSSDSHKERKPRKSLLNLSKFINDEQREQILQFIQLPNTVFEITRLPSHKQIAALQKLVIDEFGIKLSYYMSSKLVDIMLKESLIPATSAAELKDSLESLSRLRRTLPSYENAVTKSDKQSSSEEADSSNELLSE